MITSRTARLAAAAALALALLCLPAAPASAERPRKPYALIFGTVWGPDDRPVAGVKVKIRRADQKKAKWELYSDRRGEFAQRVPAGQAEYVIWADVKTRDGKPRPETRVQVNYDEVVDVGLHLTE